MVTGRLRSQSRPVRRLSTRRSLRLLGHASRWNTAWLPPQNRSVPTDSLIDKPPGIPRFSASVALSVVSAHKNSGTSSGMQLRSNVTGIRFSCAFLAANSLSIWQSPGGMDGN
jgi:hypothetical protein